MPPGLAFLHADILSHLLPKLCKSDGTRLREVSREARAAYDAQAISLRVRDTARRGNDAAALENACQSAAGIFSRGCRPRILVLDLNSGKLEKRRQATLSLLRAVAEAATTAPSPMPTSHLAMPSVLLDASLAAGIAAAFPCLTRLSLRRAELLTSEASSAGLVALFAREAVALASTSRDSRQGPVLTSLELLEASVLSRPLCAALGRCDRLRELYMQNTRELSVKDAANLAALTQLHCTTLCTSLTSLTSLDLGDSPRNWQLSPLALATLTGLQHLSIKSTLLEATGLEALAQLTSLEVSIFAAPVPRNGVTGRAPHTGEPIGLLEPCALPPLLRRLVLHGVMQRAEVLAALRPPACLTWLEFRNPTQHVTLLQHPTCVSASNVLQQEGEAVLCAVFGFLARPELRPGLQTLEFLYDNIAPDVALLRAELLPRGDGGAGGAPSHYGAWLAALGGVRVRDLRLTGVALNEQDLRTIAQHFTALEELTLSRCTFAIATLPTLARLPKLTWLSINVLSCWTEGGPHDLGPVTIPPEAPQALLAFCTAAAPRLHKLLLFSDEEISIGDGDSITLLVSELREMLQASGLDPDVVEMDWALTESGSMSGSEFGEEDLDDGYDDLYEGDMMCGFPHEYDDHEDDYEDYLMDCPF
ncbi:hypothetical protein TSOC_003161 [Tetrabaena socialis]|uniref:Uncharacterized protein n=1 Tax=Tetrabaena socialis TaxID=47790 RepID=A0A2J8AC95_9CHLO|nr:hypothetical protein TSOC_003161 [Tetrabaena socialis]|eukprot:PNH10145.1 hypothetical protein TSOC_003161 [Tetrabaena socialis]